MQFNEKEGAIIADSRATIDDVFESGLGDKLHPFHTGHPAFCVVGFSGAAEFITNVIAHATASLKEEETTITGTSLATRINDSLIHTKRTYLDNYLKATFGISEVEFQTGYKMLPNGSREPINPTLLNTYHDIITTTNGSAQINRITNSSALVLASDPKSIHLFKVSTAFGIPFPVTRPYQSLGNGQHIAEEVLYTFFEHTPRESLASIDPVHGLAALLAANHRASVRSTGVGGIPRIAIVSATSSLVLPSEAACMLAQEIVIGTKQGFLSPQFQGISLYQLFYAGASVDGVEREMYKVATPHGDALNRFLRGWKDSKN